MLILKLNLYTKVAKSIQKLLYGLKQNFKDRHKCRSLKFCKRFYQIMVCVGLTGQNHSGYACFLQHHGNTKTNSRFRHYKANHLVLYHSILATPLLTHAP
jgi:hypothetical protein